MSPPAFALIKPSTVVFSVYQKKLTAWISESCTIFQECHFLYYLCRNLFWGADSEFTPVNVHILCINVAFSVLGVV